MKLGMFHLSRGRMSSQGGMYLISGVISVMSELATPVEC
jgi:hypothetical protein